MNPCFFIFGYGYTAKELAPKLIARVFKIIGTSRNPDEQQANSLGIKVIDFNCHGIENYLSLATHLLICIPPTIFQGDIVLNTYGDLIKKHSPHLKWLAIFLLRVCMEIIKEIGSMKKQYVPLIRKPESRDYKLNKIGFLFPKDINCHCISSGYQEFMVPEETPLNV